jgi:uncharacterized membrane protein
MVSLMLAVVLYIVFKLKEISLMIIAPMAGFSLVCFIALKIISTKRRITRKEFLATLNDILAFYNANTLQQR